MNGQIRLNQPAHLQMPVVWGLTRVLRVIKQMGILISYDLLSSTISGQDRLMLQDFACVLCPEAAGNGVIQGLKLKHLLFPR
jgi:hypothetical protein